MSGLADQFPGFQKGAGGAVAPSDIDLYQQFTFSNIGTSSTAFGTAELTAAGALVITNTMPDYPRNVLFSILGVAGGMGGSATVYGRDRWGNTISEGFNVGSANAGGSVAGTRIFARVTSATLDSIDGLGGTAVGTTRIGYAIGTSATLKMWLGLPTKIAAVSDVKHLNYVKNFVPTPLLGGTLDSTVVSTAYHAIGGTEIAGSVHTYSVMYKSTYDNSGKANLSQLA
jgi:hypothetical protein